MDLTTLEPTSMTCPRCGESAVQRLYGPCADCVTQLYAKYPGVAREMETEEYVPKMNVTPNAVATKD